MVTSILVVPLVHKMLPTKDENAQLVLIMDSDTSKIGILTPEKAVFYKLCDSHNHNMQRQS